MKIRNTAVLGLAVLVLSFGLSRPAPAQTCDVPLFVTTGVKPNILVAEDTSGSMREATDTSALGAYNNNPTAGNYTTAYSTYLGTLDPATSSLRKHMLFLNGATLTFTDAAVYDSAEHLVCQAWNVEPCNTQFGLSDEAKCHLGKAVGSSHAACGNSYASIRSTVGANGRGYSLANGNAGFTNVQTLFRGRYLNWVHRSQVRDDLARQAMRNVVDLNRAKLNAGLMTLRYFTGGIAFDTLDGLLVSPIDGIDSDASADAVIGSLDNYDGSIRRVQWLTGWNQDGLIINSFGQTPLARMLYSSYEYFRGEHVNPDGATFPSPLSVRCQKCFVILMSDGRPTAGDLQENQLPAMCGAADTDQSREGSNDDAFAVDEMASCLHRAGDLSTGFSDRQEMNIYSVGFSNDQGNQYFDILNDAATAGGGKFYFASTAHELATALGDALQDILNRISSATSVAVASTAETSGDYLVQASFQPGAWQGFLKGFALPYDPNAAPLWDAASLLEFRSPGNRLIFTAREGNDADTRLDDRLDFTVANAATLQPLLGTATLTDAQNIVRWIQGEAVTGYRSRDPQRTGREWKLGDIVNSTPVIVGTPPYFYPDASYQTFHDTYASRPPVVYVGANDGMVHAFDAATGVERWAFIPNNLLPKLKDLTSASYCHEYFVDGSPRVVDAFVRVDGGTAAWRTILLIGEGEGGGAYVALDVTDPGPVGTPNLPGIVWQFPNPTNFSSPAVLADLRVGKATSRAEVHFYSGGIPPAAFPGDATAEGSWRAVFGSGLGNSNGDGYLYILSVNLGTTITNGIVNVDPDDEAGNSLTDPVAVDLDGDRSIDRIFAGDMLGRLWRYRVSDGSVQKVYDTDTGAQNTRPITTRPVASFVSSDLTDPNVLLYFGTGKYFTTADRTDTSIQRLYGILDNGTSTLDPGRVALWADADVADRTDADPSITQITGGGWRIDLKLDANGEPGSANPAEGARVLESPLLVNRVLFFPIFKPTNDVCDYGGQSYLVGVDYLTGNPPALPVLDANGDGVVDDLDKRNGAVPRGVYLGTGLPARPVLDAERNTLIIQKSDATVNTVVIRPAGSPIEGIRWRVER